MVEFEALRRDMQSDRASTNWISEKVILDKEHEKKKKSRGGGKKLK